MGNGSPENGGCEAITKGTIEILKRSFPEVIFIDSFFDYTGNYKNYKEKGIIPVSYPSRWTFKWIVLQLLLKISSTLTAILLYCTHRKSIKKADVVLSLGGDNYSLDYGVPRRFIALGKYIKKQNVPFIIWGASIGPFKTGSRFEAKMASHLKKDVDLILLREKESLKYLETIGVKDNVAVVADPAFMMIPENCMQKQNVQLPPNYICVNFSDLMAKYVTNGDMRLWVELCVKIIHLLLNEVEYPLVFIPHVKSDYDFMQYIRSFVEDSSRIILIDKNLNAAEMKWIISKAECNIACRTHSTIASFSTAVPTISLGYSMKSKGLNLQMYGHERYLLYKTEITPIKVLSAFREVSQSNDRIRKELKQKNGIIKEQAMMAGQYLKEILDKI